MYDNILVIGNGFDLYHGLPTRYTDFLELVKQRRLFYKKSVALVNTSDVVVGDGVRFDKLMIPYDKCNKEKLIRFDTIINCNFFVYYFIQTRYTKENWIDFENEIEKILYCIYDCFQDKSIYNTMYDYFVEAKNWTHGDPFYSDIDKLLRILKSSLEELVEALDIFFSEFIDKAKIRIYSKQIAEIQPQAIINFNYTNTYNKVYIQQDLAEQIPTHHIHGEINKNNMVLGVKDKINDIRFVYFKKYFQRIQKMTGIDYKGWINYKDVGKTKRFHVIGHSVDETDGDIFQDIIKSDLTDKVIFYYHNQEAYEGQVINLIKILGKDEFLSLLYKEKIVFRKLKEGESIADELLQV